MVDRRPTIMTVDEVAKYLRMHEMTIYRMATEGRLPAYKVGNRWRFKKERIDEWLLSQENNRNNKKPKGRKVK